MANLVGEIGAAGRGEIQGVRASAMRDALKVVEEHGCVFGPKAYWPAANLYMEYERVLVQRPGLSPSQYFDSPSVAAYSTCGLSISVSSEIWSLCVVKSLLIQSLLPVAECMRRTVGQNHQQRTISHERNEYRPEMATRQIALAQQRAIVEELDEDTEVARDSREATRAWRRS